MNFETINIEDAKIGDQIVIKNSAGIPFLGTVTESHQNSRSPKYWIVRIADKRPLHDKHRGTICMADRLSAPIGVDWDNAKVRRVVHFSPEEIAAEEAHDAYMRQEDADLM